MTYVFVTNREWNKKIVSSLIEETGSNFIVIDKKQDFTLENMTKINPTKIFVAHWSYIIPASIYNKYECIIFHMTDLPYGRGGSPLQNLILAGKTETVVSAVRCVDIIDGGDIYAKFPLDLSGSAQDIFERAVDVIGDMIVYIIKKNPVPVAQAGDVTRFIRRMPEQSEITHLTDLKQIYDYIRMLDADGYPHAFLDTEHFRVLFTGARLNPDGNEIAAKVVIRRK